MKVTELRAELEALGLDTKGKKADLETRLQASLEADADDARAPSPPPRVSLAGADAGAPAPPLAPCLPGDSTIAPVARDLAHAQELLEEQARRIAEQGRRIAEQAKELAPFHAAQAKTEEKKAAAKKKQQEKRAVAKKKADALREANHMCTPQRKGETDEAFAERCGLKFPLKLHEPWQPACGEDPSFNNGRCSASFKKGDPERNECCGRLPWGVFPCCNTWEEETTYCSKWRGIHECPYYQEFIDQHGDDY
jgi:hypothetical protein